MGARSALAVVALLCAVHAPAWAHGPDGPALQAGLEIAFPYDSSRANGRGGHVLFAEAELALEARLGDRWRADIGLVLEPVLEERALDRAIARHGAFVETLARRFEGRNGWARLGKLTPRFGTGWHAAAGIYGADFAEDYELSERWGVELGGRLGSERWGSHELAVSGSTVDASPLSRSLFTDRGPNRRRDGGPGNTGRPDSITVSLDGNGPGRLGGLRYHAAFVRQGRGRGDPRRESGLVLGLEMPVALPAAVEATAFVEHARLFDAAGLPGDATYTTASLELGRGRWLAALALASRQRGGPEATRDRLLEVSAGYRFDSGTVLRIGWRGARENGRTSHGLGIRVSRVFRLGS